MRINSQVLMFVMPAFLSACAPPPAGEEQSRIKRGLDYDAGPIFADTTPVLTHAFTMTNDTDRPLKVVGESHSCDCTQVEIKHGLLQPGQSVPLVLTVSVPQGYSDKNLSCTVKTEPPLARPRHFTLRFRSYPRARIVPDRIDLGILKHGEQPSGQTASLEFYAEPGHSPDQPSDLDIPDELRITFVGEPIFGKHPDGVTVATYPLLIELLETPRADGAGVANFSAGSSGTAVATGLVAWRYAAPVAIDPPLIHFGIVPRDSLSEREIKLSSRDGTVFKILDLGTDSPFVRPRLFDDSVPAQASPTHSIIVEMPPMQTVPSPTLTGVVRVKTDITLGGDLEIPWSAFRNPSVDPKRDGASEASTFEEGAIP